MDNTTNAQNDVAFARETLSKYIGKPCKVISILTGIITVSLLIIIAVSFFMMLFSEGIGAAFGGFADIEIVLTLLIMIAFPMFFHFVAKTSFNFGKNIADSSKYENLPLRELTLEFLGYVPSAVKSWLIAYIVYLIPVCLIFIGTLTQGELSLGLYGMLTLLPLTTVGAFFALCFLGIPKLWQLIRRNGVIIGGGWIIIALIIMVAWLLLLIFSITTIYQIIRDVTKMHKIVKRAQV